MENEQAEDCTMTETQGCTFLTKLPLEIRLQIYELAIGQPQILYSFRDFDYDEIRLEMLNDYADRPFIVLVNRQIRNEALPVFHKSLAWQFGCTRDLASCFNRNDFDRKGNLGAERALLATVTHLRQFSFVCCRTASTVTKVIHLHCPNLQQLTISRVTLKPLTEWAEELPEDVTLDDFKGLRAKQTVRNICFNRFVEMTDSSQWWRNMLYMDKRQFKVCVESTFVPESMREDVNFIKYVYDFDTGEVLELHVDEVDFGLESLFAS